MRRRAFITLLGGAAFAGSLSVRAQQPRKLQTIGYLGPATRTLDSQRLAAFVERLRGLGWIEGRTIAIEYRWAEGRNERLAEIILHPTACTYHCGMDVLMTCTRTSPGKVSAPHGASFLEKQIAVEKAKADAVTDVQLDTACGAARPVLLHAPQ